MLNEAEELALELEELELEVSMAFLFTMIGYVDTTGLNIHSTKPLIYSLISGTQWRCFTYDLCSIINSLSLSK